MRTLKPLTMLAVLALVAGPPLQAESKMEFSMLAGGTVSMGSEADVALTPVVKLEVTAPLSTSDRGPTLNVQAGIGSLPGEATPDITKPETFRSLDFRVGLEQPITTGLLFNFYAECGFATRLPGDLQPRDKAPRWCGGGVSFKSDKALLRITGNADQRLSISAPDGALSYQATIGVSGRIEVYATDRGAIEASVNLIGEAILGLDLSAKYPTLNGGRHDSVRLGVAIGI